MGRPRMTDEQKAEAKRKREAKMVEVATKPVVPRPETSPEAVKALEESTETPLSQEEALKLMETWKDQSLKQNKGSTAVEY